VAGFIAAEERAPDAGSTDPSSGPSAHGTGAARAGEHGESTMNSRKSIVALALIAALGLFGTACEQQETGDPIEDDTQQEDAGTPTPEETPEEGDS
jgi:hypothetical protein